MTPARTAPAGVCPHCGTPVHLDVPELDEPWPDVRAEQAFWEGPEFAQAVREGDAAGLIRAARRRTDLTQDQIAHAAGISQPLVSRIEAGATIHGRAKRQRAIVGLLALREQRCL